MRPAISKRSANRALVALAAAALVALAPTTALACQPCQETLDLPRSLAKAELVVVAKMAKMPAEPDDPRGGAACSDLTVERVLKGELKGKGLRVRRWYGMCPYGIILGEGTYVVILGKASPTDYEQLEYQGGECGKALKEKRELYVPVEFGCAVKALRVEDGKVEAEGVRLTLDEFRDRYGLAGAGARFQSPAAWSNPFEVTN